MFQKEDCTSYSRKHFGVFFMPHSVLKGNWLTTWPGRCYCLCLFIQHWRRSCTGKLVLLLHCHCCMVVLLLGFSLQFCTKCWLGTWTNIWLLTIFWTHQFNNVSKRWQMSLFRCSFLKTYTAQFIMWYLFDQQQQLRNTKWALLSAILDWFVLDL